MVVSFSWLGCRPVTAEIREFEPPHDRICFLYFRKNRVVELAFVAPKINSSLKIRKGGFLVRIRITCEYISRESEWNIPIS